MKKSTGWISACVVAAGCSAAPTAARDIAVAGMDGPLTVNAPNTIVNRYAALARDAAVGDLTLTLTANTLAPLGRGDLLLIIQAQGAQIDTSDTARFGSVTNLGGAGQYELVVVESVAGTVVTLNSACGLRHAFSAAGATQVVRVPQVTQLTVGTAGSIVAPPWNGAVGGLVALSVQGAARIDGAIDVTGRGFRGGLPHNQSNDPMLASASYRSSVAAGGGGEKGESVAGSVATYTRLGVQYGRGAPANGGGGGNAHNASGGGGANAGNPATWTGQGVMDGSATGNAAWRLDPGYIANGNALTTSSGGGRGGYSYSQSIAVGNPDPTRFGPGSAAWGGNGRREAGGLGGRPLPADPAARLFLGGGGGAGDENNGAGGTGGSGGGLVLLIADTVAGTGQVRADGAAASTTMLENDDGSGGGGGGGAVVVAARSATGVGFSASGGRGGVQPSSPTLTSELEAEGPGGGGGGGYVVLPGGGSAARVVGGAAGTTAAVVMSLFPLNGATGGGAGISSLMSVTPPICTVVESRDMAGADLTTPPPDGSGGAPDAAPGADGGGPGADGGGPGADGAGGPDSGWLGYSFAGGAPTCNVAPHPGGGGAFGLLLPLVAVILGYRRRRASAANR